MALTPAQQAELQRLKAMYQPLAEQARRDALRQENMAKMNPQNKAEGGAVKNPFDYENANHVDTVAGIASKHKDFSSTPQAHHHLGEMLSTGNWKYIEDPRIQSGQVLRPQASRGRSHLGRRDVDGDGQVLGRCGLDDAAKFLHAGIFDVRADDRHAVLCGRGRD